MQKEEGATPFVQNCGSATAPSCTLSPAVPVGKIFVVQTITVNVHGIPMPLGALSMVFATVAGITSNGHPLGASNACATPCIEFPAPTIGPYVGGALIDATSMFQVTIYEDAGNAPTINFPKGGTSMGASFTGILVPKH
jgi:hypothetical protein